MVYLLVNGLLFGYRKGCVFAATDLYESDKNMLNKIYDLDGNCLSSFSISDICTLMSKTREAMKSYNVTILDALAGIEKKLEEIDDFIFWRDHAGEHNSERLAFLLDLYADEYGADTQGQIKILEIHLRNKFIRRNAPDFYRYCVAVLFKLKRGKPGSLHILKNHADNLYKISRSAPAQTQDTVTDISLKATQAVQLEHSIQCDDYVRAEADLYRRFAKIHKQQDNWFRLSADVLSWLKSVRSYNTGRFLDDTAA